MLLLQSFNVLNYLRWPAIVAVTGILAIAPLANAEPIRGAGSTFAAPIIHQWSRDYETARMDGGDFTSPDWNVDYEPVGSLAGVMRLDQPEMDFAATDAPLAPEDLKTRNLAQFPIVMGGIVVATNIAGVRSGQLRLSGPILADIYLGKITTWSDPNIKAINPDLNLPNANIAVLYREDGSGSTAAFTNFLSKVSVQWHDKVGSDTLVKWPHGRGERGTGGLATLADATENSIAYLEYGQAVRLGMSYASLQNQSGAFVQPDVKSFQLGLANVAWDPARDFSADTTNLAGEGAYPIAVVTYAVIPIRHGRDRVERVLDLFRLALAKGSEKAAALGYIPVSAELTTRIEAYWANRLNASINN